MAQTKTTDKVAELSAVVNSVEWMSAIAEDVEWRLDRLGDAVDEDTRADLRAVSSLIDRALQSLNYALSYVSGETKTEECVSEEEAAAGLSALFG